MTMRVARSLAGADLLREEITGWLTARRCDARFTRFGHHFVVLEQLLYGTLAALRADIVAAGELRPSELAYARCAHLDDGVRVVRRVFDWYAPRYDQRLDQRYGPALAAADEVVRACWWQPFEVLGRTPPTGPLPYLDPFFDAYATPRSAVPRDLLPLLDELPIPLIALPGWAASEAWWLVVAAHETGHVVLHDLGLTSAVRLALGERSAWAEEVFADVYSVLMVGTAARWLVDELEHGRTRPSDYYPPPDLRLALMVAGDLLALEVDGVPLRELGPGFDPALAGVWTERLTDPHPVITKVTGRASARTMIAAGVQAHAAAPAVVHANLLAHLPRCGPEGTLGSPARPDVRAVTDRLIRRLL